MSRTLFENSKAALAFAGMTLLGAIAMVGTSENDGVLPRVADTIAEQQSAKAAAWAAATEQQSMAAPRGSGPGQGAIFGDYDPVRNQLQPPAAATDSLAEANAAAAAAAAAAITPGPDPVDNTMNAF